ncbi:hypothetical protein BCV70DRAFT_195423 [Testicularia cyperi]|uniref:Uncharacterized protein n=1 Tax=Testicularia cyperi TaxID=1882483 RepID=A0A317XGW4_9BASI|nr:hypothetical protein BCV70DRAFT_195423 [Testicularia cyperi]
MHPAAVIFLSVLFTQAIAALGKDRLQEALYVVYANVVDRKTLSRQRSLRKEIFTTKQELAATSSQDQFSKWAKLRRKVDKGLQELERLNGQVASSRTKFSMLFKALMFVLTTVLPFVVTSYYSKTPIFWLPPGQSSWFGPLGWFLALPRAPRGSISSTMWQMVCTRSVIALVGSLTSLVPGKTEEVLASDSKAAQNVDVGADATPASQFEKPTAKAAGQQPAGAASPGPRRRTAASSSAGKEEL